ncbi:hypothetical protein BJX99DRAFT_186269 [Aspergillus californicus]
MSQTLGPLDYGCTEWRISSQRAADLYNSGTRLFIKEDLEDIEQQLRQSYDMERFTVRRMDGTIIQISNPMFHVRNPIWYVDILFKSACNLTSLRKPCVKFQEYWKLVASQPPGPTETWLCSYIVEWDNKTARNFRELTDIAQRTQHFDEKQFLWQNSKTCKQLASFIQDLLGENTMGTIPVKKVLCFGLGDFCRSAPEWLKRQEADGDKMMENDSMGCMIQHSMALTIAQLCQGETLLLAQDPDYTKTAEEILTQKEFKVVGTQGAGAFAEIDDDSIVISPFPAAPVKQIIADLGRPALIITGGVHSNVMNVNKKPYADPESLRTRQMWLDYDRYSIPNHKDEDEICSALGGLQLYRRRQQPLDSSHHT